MAKKKVTAIHPARHEWLMHGDFVTMRDAKQITEIVREEHCEHCARERLTKIGVVYWEIIRRWYRGKNVPMDERALPNRELATEILATTNNQELRQQILAQRNGR